MKAALRMLAENRGLPL